MKTLHIVVITLFAVLALTAGAEATVDLWTPPLLVAANEELACLVVNTTTRPVTVTITIHSFQRGVIVNSGPFSSPDAVRVAGDSPHRHRGPGLVRLHRAVEDNGRGSAQTSVTNVAVPAQ